MKILELQVPTGITKLSQWTELESLLPEGRYILDKVLTGCGATTMFLEIFPKPVILCSHRSELLECKSKSNRHKGNVHLFKSSYDTTSADLRRNKERLTEYLSEFVDGRRTGFPKILVTTDSLVNVAPIAASFGIDFTVISDEMQCIFTDAPFKGDKVLSYLDTLSGFKNVIFLSATPYLEKYLDKLVEFRELPIIRLVWPSDAVEVATITPYYASGLVAAANSKIRDYLKNGYFEKTGYGQAEQGIFFFNSISDIIRVIKSLDLGPDMVNIICSNSNRQTVQKLSQIGFKPGHAQLEGEPHKPITFVTKCAFEGADFYHPTGYTYIFSDPEISNLALDLSIDLPQILGRQRLDSNPWKNYATIFYRTSKSSSIITQDQFNEFQSGKDKTTELLVEAFNSTASNPALVSELGNIFNESIALNHYSRSYVSILVDPKTGLPVAAPNPLVRIAEERAFDIRCGQYNNRISVLRSMAPLGNLVQNEVQVLNQFFIDHRKFTDRMKFYCDFRDAHPELELQILGAIAVPIRYHGYYDKYGHQKIKSVSYRESMILERFENKQPKVVKVLTVTPELVAAVKAEFPVGIPLEKSEIKARLQPIYDRMGIKKTAFSGDLAEIIPVKSVNMVSKVSGKTVNGFRPVNS